MPIVDQIVGTGTSPFAAAAISGGAATALTGAGTNSLANATLLSVGNNFFTTVAASSGAKLPACSPGSSVYVYNGGGSTLTVYGNTSAEGIANGSVGAGFLITANKGCEFKRASATLWTQNLSA